MNREGDRHRNGPQKIVVPAKAGTQRRSFKRHWIPAFAGMTTYDAVVTELRDYLLGSQNR
jgi:hypothetical protein